MTVNCWYCGTPLPAHTTTKPIPGVGLMAETAPDYRGHAATCTLANVCGAPIDPPAARQGLPARLASICRRRPRYDDGRCRVHVGT